MRIRVLGAGFYGCFIASSLIADGHDVEVHEVSDRIFSGASGNIPARLHLGAPHYPRSFATQVACQEHQADFMRYFGRFTRAVPVNIYAIAAHESLVDFETYRRVLRGQVEFLTIHDPAEFGLTNVEGAVMIGERHIVVDRVRDHFSNLLGWAIKLEMPQGVSDDESFDVTVDCTFCARDSAGVDRYEPCLVVLMEGPVGRSTTIMDGMFPSLYVWDPDRGLSSLSSAKYSPFSKSCKTWEEARALLDSLTPEQVNRQARDMLESMARFYPAIHREYSVASYRTSIRAMPLSGADTRLVDVVRVNDRTIRVRAGKIDAIFAAADIVKGMLNVQSRAA